MIRLPFQQSDIRFLSHCGVSSSFHIRQHSSSSTSYSASVGAVAHKQKHRVRVEQKHSIFLEANEIPVIAGFNRYRRFEDLFYTVWKRTHPNQVKTSQQRLTWEGKLTFQTREETLGGLAVQAAIGMKQRPLRIDSSSTVAELAGTAEVDARPRATNHTSRFISKSLFRYPCIRDKSKRSFSTSDRGELTASSSSATAAPKKASSSFWTVPTHSRTTQIMQKIAEARVPPSLTSSEKKELKQYFLSKLHRDYGIQQEPRSIQHYEKLRNIQVTHRNSFFKKSVGSIDNRCCNVLVGGRIDGKLNDSTILEVKNRTERFISPLPLYDVAQLQTYLYLLGASDGILEEHLWNYLTLKTKSTKIAWDQNFWQSQMLPHVGRFSHSLLQLMNDEEIQRDFLLSDGDKRKDILLYLWFRTPAGLWDHDLV